MITWKSIQYNVCGFIVRIVHALKIRTTFVTVAIIGTEDFKIDISTETSARLHGKHRDFVLEDVQWRQFDVYLTI